MKRLSAVVLLLASATAVRAQDRSDDAETFFEARVRPLLAAKCVRCHGPQKASGGLRLDSRETLLAGGKNGPAAVPGEPQNSLLVRAVRRGESRKMPPDEPLAADTIADLERWIAQGAVWPARADPAAIDAARHWAFEPVRPVAVPDDPTGWSAGPIDRFIRAKQMEHGLAPLAAADRATLLRRATFDLVGLPPAPNEVDAFVHDDSPDAWARVVERLLASPHYGERWGRHWMDVVRYADTAGDNADYPVPEARLYRDYIIAAFNADEPYDEFVREQLAGDILARREPGDAARYARRVAATGFLALSRRYGTGPYELWHLTLEDTIDTTGRALLGLTLRCARCHDHKFDPVSTEDYYALYGIFASTQFPWAGSEEVQSKKFDRMHFPPLVPPEQAAPKLAEYQARIAALEAEIKQAEAAGQAAEKLNELRDRLRLLRKPGLPGDLPGAYAVAEATPSDARVQRAGEPGDLGEVVPRGAPKFLSRGAAPEIPAGESGRWQLAQWLTRPDNPLTARVLVNRVWQYHFGKGLVPTPSNFGLRGEPPTHPELLDWLTAEFVTHGWSIKHLHRLIVLSQTYRIASGEDAALAGKDPGNHWYWRFDRRRLEAEAIRDAMLAVADRLDRQPVGEQPFPPIAEWSWTQHSPFKAVYPSQHRSVYLMTQRLQRHPYLALFDGPDPNVSTDVRTSATVPLQALYLMNNPFVTEQADGLAARLVAVGPSRRERIALAYRLCYAREPRGGECERDLAYVERYVAELAAAGVPTAAAELEAWTSFARVLLTANEFVYVD